MRLEFKMAHISLIINLSQTLIHNLSNYQRTGQITCGTEAKHKLMPATEQLKKSEFMLNLNRRKLLELIHPKQNRSNGTVKWLLGLNKSHLRYKPTLQYWQISLNYKENETIARSLDPQHSSSSKFCFH